jgi:hypothetical protein
MLRRRKMYTYAIAFLLTTTDSWLIVRSVCSNGVILAHAVSPYTSIELCYGAPRRRIRMTVTLRPFLANLATDPDRLAAYLADPDGVARAAGLTDADISALGSADQQRIHARLLTNAATEDPPPVHTPDEPSPVHTPDEPAPVHAPEEPAPVHVPEPEPVHVPEEPTPAPVHAPEDEPAPPPVHV